MSAQAPVRIAAWMAVFPMLVLVGAYVLAFDRGSDLLVYAGVFMLVAGVVGTLFALLVTGLLDLLRGALRGDWSGSGREP